MHASSTKYELSLRAQILVLSDPELIADVLSRARCPGQ
jgi:hypothetical protein